MEMDLSVVVDWTKVISWFKKVSNPLATLGNKDKFPVFKQFVNIASESDDVTNIIHALLMACK